MIPANKNYKKDIKKKKKKNLLKTLESPCLSSSNGHQKKA